MLSSICNLTGVCEPNYRHSPRPTYEESLEANTSHGTSPRPPEDETCAVSRTPAHVESDVVTTKSDTIPGSGVIKSITTDTVTITPQLKHPLEPGEVAITGAPRHSCRYGVELTTGVKVASAAQGITISRPGQKDKEVSSTCFGLVDDGLGFGLYDGHKVSESVHADGSIDLSYSVGGSMLSAHICSDGKVSGHIRSYSDGENVSVPASELPDGAIVLELPYTADSETVVVQPYLTRKDVNG